MQLSIPPYLFPNNFYIGHRRLSVEHTETFVDLPKWVTDLE